MKKLLIGFLLGVLPGFAAGAFLVLVKFPFWFPPAVVQEAPPPGTVVTRSGEFIHVDPEDPWHWGRGHGTLRSGPGGQFVYLEPSFEVGPGPYFFVYLSEAVDIRDGVDFQQAGRVRVGRLKSFSDAQRYALPAGTETARYPSIVVWCEAFDQLISVARLRPAPPEHREP